jgi:hypothetical protein
MCTREICYTLRKAQVVTERWRKEYNVFRPHSLPNYRSPTPEAVTTTWMVHSYPLGPFLRSGGQGTIQLT